MAARMGIRSSFSLARTLADMIGRRGDSTPGAIRFPPQSKSKPPVPPLTFCTNGFNHKYVWSHVMGFTATYNDFDYTGAVFRLEESLSTKEGLDKRAVGYGQAFPFQTNVPQGYRERRGHILVTTPVWRSMVGFDLAQSLSSYPGLAWTRKLPGEFGSQQSFPQFSMAHAV